MRAEEEIGRGLARQRSPRNVGELAEAIAHHFDFEPYLHGEDDPEECMSDLVEAILWTYRGYMELGGICFFNGNPVPEELTHGTGTFRRYGPGNNRAGTTLGLQMAQPNGESASPGRDTNDGSTW